MKVLLCSEEDEASQNMKQKLLDGDLWLWTTPDTPTTGEDLALIASAKDHQEDTVYLVQTPLRHLFVPEPVERLERMLGERPDLVVLLSRHASASGMKTLTVHHTGNFNKADYGGEDRTLSTPAPAWTTQALRLLKEKAKDVEEFTVCFESTHHGPTYTCPHFFIEIGSSLEEWTRDDMGTIITNTLTKLFLAPPPTSSVTLVGIGGGHYAPRHTDVALSTSAAFAHIIPTYAIEAMGDDLSMLKVAMGSSNTDKVYLHRKGMKGPMRRTVIEYLGSNGFQMVSSNDLHPL